MEVKIPVDDSTVIDVIVNSIREWEIKKGQYYSCGVKLRPTGVIMHWKQYYRLASISPLNLLFPNIITIRPDGSMFILGVKVFRSEDIKEDELILL